MWFSWNLWPKWRLKQATHLQAMAYLYLIYMTPKQIPTPKYFQTLRLFGTCICTLFSIYWEYTAHLKSIVTKYAPQFWSTEVPEEDDSGDHPLGETRTWRQLCLDTDVLPSDTMHTAQPLPLKLLSGTCRSMQVSEIRILMLRLVPLSIWLTWGRSLFFISSSLSSLESWYTSASAPSDFDVLRCFF